MSLRRVHASDGSYADVPVEGTSWLPDDEGAVVVEEVVVDGGGSTDEEAVVPCVRLRGHPLYTEEGGAIIVSCGGLFVRLAHGRRHGAGAPVVVRVRRRAS